MRYLTVFFGLAAGNFVFAWATEIPAQVAIERSWFQGIAVFALALAQYMSDRRAA